MPSAASSTAANSASNGSRIAAILSRAGPCSMSQCACARASTASWLFLIFLFAGMMMSPVSVSVMSTGSFSFITAPASFAVRSFSSLAIWFLRFFSASFFAFLLDLSSAVATSWLVETCTPMTTPVVPGGTTSDVSRTSAAFSPKMARSRRSSGDSSVSPFGVTLPTRMSPGLTSAPTRTMPSGPRFFSASSLTFGMSRVISSGPSFVSRAPHSNVTMCSDVSMSSRTQRSLIRIASSKL